MAASGVVTKMSQNATHATNMYRKQYARVKPDKFAFIVKFVMRADSVVSQSYYLIR